MPAPLRIGFSACFFHGDPSRPLFKGKTLLYLEESIAHWILSEGVCAFLVPTVGPRTKVTVKDLIEDLDGLVLQGGTDVSPELYGEKPIKPEWAGDAVRDRYEIALVRECIEQKKPVLGICRGAQLLNVALGGTLYQDIETQVPKAKCHRNWEAYEKHFHEIRFEKDSVLARLYQDLKTGRVNSVHHQAVKDLGKGVRVEARSVEDGVVEAIHFEGDPFIFAFQWHPEFHDPDDFSLLDCKPILKEFLKKVSERKQRR